MPLAVNPSQTSTAPSASPPMEKNAQEENPQGKAQSIAAPSLGRFRFIVGPERLRFFQTNSATLLVP